MAFPGYVERPSTVLETVILPLNYVGLRYKEY